MMLINVMLGMMFGVALLLIVKAIVKRDLSIIVPVLPMFVVAIPETCARRGSSLAIRPGTP